MIRTLLLLLLGTSTGTQIIFPSTPKKEKTIKKDAAAAKLQIASDIKVQQNRAYWYTLKKAERAIAIDEFDPRYDTDTSFFTALINKKDPYIKIHKIETDILALKKSIEETIAAYPNAISAEEQREWEKECTSFATTLKNSGAKIYAARIIAQQLIAAATETGEQPTPEFTQNKARNIRFLKKMIPHLPAGIREVEQCKNYYPELIAEAYAQTSNQQLYWGPPYIYMPHLMNPAFALMPGNQFFGSY